MKANEAPDFPEKVYIPRDPEYPQSPNIWWERELSESNIEYTRTDSFIDKAWNWVEDNILSSNQQDKSRLYYEQFEKYMKGE